MRPLKVQARLKAAAPLMLKTGANIMLHKNFEASHVLETRRKYVQDML
jgi:hypothetical protein